MLSRRKLLTQSLLAGAAIVSLNQTPLMSREISDEPYYSGGAPWADLLGWKLGCHSYCFQQFTFEEALQKNASMGLRYLEISQGQSLTKTNDTKVHVGMNRQERFELKTLLTQYGIVPVSIGVVNADRQGFDFAAEMGLQFMEIEPEFHELPAIDKMAQEYDIHVAIHNHPEPSRYWDYKTTLEKINDLSPYTGMCVDTGHFARSGIDPLEVVKAVQKRIKTFHFKDLNEASKQGHDVIWGTGVCKVGAILEELKKQKFRGPFIVEYEYNWDNSVPEIAASVDFFNRKAQELA